MVVSGPAQYTPDLRRFRGRRSHPQLLSAKEWCVEVVREMIYTGDLAPGEKVPIESLAGELAVSRTPVRDALWHLQREGLVDVAPRVGVYVRPISPREVTDIYALKEAFEPLMARWAAERGSEEGRLRYRESVAELAALAEAGDVTRYIERLQQLRGELLALAGSEALDDLHSVIDGRVRLLRFRNLSQPGQLQRSAEQHVEIADAIMDGDASRAAGAMRRHMRDAGKRIRRLLAAHEPTGTNTATGEPASTTHAA